MCLEKEDCLPHTLLLAITNRSSLEEISAACVHTESSQKVLGLVILTLKWYTRAFKSSVLEDLLRLMWAQGECVELLWLTYFAGRLVPNKKCHHVLHLCIEDSTAA